MLGVEVRRFALEDFEGVYTRVMDEQRLPELRGEPATSPARRQGAPASPSPRRVD